MDASKLTPGDYLVGGGGFVFLISVVLPWFGLSGYSESGLDYFPTGIVPLLLIAGVITLIVLDEHTTVDLPDLPVPLALVELVGSGLALLLVLIKIAFGASLSTFTGNGEVVSVELTARFGIYLAVLSAGAVAAGVLLKVMQDGGLDQLKGGKGSNPYPPNPSPPPPQSF